MDCKLLHGDCRQVLKTLPAESVNCCVTSPPYFGLRDYGVDGQIGLEQTPDAYVAELVAVFKEVKRVLRDDGTLWLNLGDSYGTGTTAARKQGSRGLGAHTQEAQDAVGRCGGMAKQLFGIPWRVAFALQSDGWYLRQDIIWHKPNPMPESVTDRCTKAHEYLFLLTKNARYFWDAEAMKEKADSVVVMKGALGKRNGKDRNDTHDKIGGHSAKADNATRNRPSVWTIPTQPYSGAHFAVMPPRLAELCILAGSRSGDTVIDPFFGSGTTGEVAERLGRKWIGLDLNADYEALQRERTAQMAMAI